MHFSWAITLTPNPGIVPPDSSLSSFISTPSLFIPSLKSSQWAMPAPGLGYIYPFQTGGTHQQPSGQVTSKLPHDQKNTVFLWWHQLLSHVFVSWIFWVLSVSLPATEGIEENTACTPTPSTNHLNPLTSLLITFTLRPTVQPIFHSYVSTL